MHSISRDWGLVGPQVNESSTWMHDPKSGMLQVDSLMAIVENFRRQLNQYYNVGSFTGQLRPDPWRF